MVPWTHLREPPLWGKCLTDLTSEFTHFNLVIRLSKVKQSALLFSAFSWSRRSCGPLWTPLKVFLPSEAVSNVGNFLFCSNFTATLHHAMTLNPGRYTTCRCGLFLLMVFWWGETYCASNSLELVQPFMPLRHDLTTVPVQGIIARTSGYRNWVLFITYLFWFLFVTN